MIRTYFFSAAGGHSVKGNEDAFVLRSLRCEPDCWLVCIADGQGGRTGGAAAAQLACRIVSEMTGESVRPPWNDITSKADAAVAADTVAGFTTLVALTVDESSGLQTVSRASSGDSAALAVSGTGELKELTSHQFKNPPIGSSEANFIPFELELVRPWKVLAMTDGVWKYAGWERIRAAASRLSGEALIAELQVSARLRSGEFADDFTVVLLESE